jgi:hypothetical protein
MIVFDYVPISTFITIITALVMAARHQHPDWSLSSQAAAAPYQAPLTDHEPHKEHKIKGYNIYLQPGHTIADHNAAIGTKIEPFLKFKPYKQRVSERIDQGEQIVYTANNVDNDLLAAIRADPGVEEVDYYHIPAPDILELPNGENASALSPYMAPLINPEPQKEYEQKAYIVYLRSGHSLANHNAATDTNIQPFFKSKLETQEDKGGADRIVYTAVNIEDVHLTAIRSDPGVEKVDHYHPFSAKAR